MVKYIEFSYPIDPSDYVVGSGIKPPAVAARSRISDGKHSNTSYIEYFAHTGTHIDAPWHFIDDGFKIEDFSICDFVFCKPFLIEIKANTWEPIPLHKFLPFEKEISSCDCLLIHSGFSDKRSTDKQVYIEATPGLTVESAEYLSGFQNIRCVGVDFISIENVKKGRETGFPVHHALLGNRTPRILLEDADISKLYEKEINKIFLFPVRVIGIEASPVTAVAEIVP
jgi:kynurenine formamidase